MNAQTANIKTFYKGQVIFKEGQESSVAYMIRKGSVVISRVVNNRKLTLDTLGEGEIFGEMGVIASGARTADAEAAEYCELVVLTKPVLDNLLSTSPKTIQILTKALVRRLKRTTELVPDTDYKSAFVSTCQILDILWAAHVNLPQAERKNVPNWDLGLNLAAVVKRVKAIVLVSQQEVENVLTKLANLKVVALTTLRPGRTAFAERYVRLSDPASFLEVAGNLHKELTRTSHSLRTELEYVDLVDFARDVGTTPEMLYRKLGQGEVPESLFFFHRARAMDWAERMGPEFFRKVRKKSPSELVHVDDIIHVDNATLKKVFERLGYYKLGVLMSLAGAEAKKKISHNLSKKLAGIVEAEAQNRPAVEHAEAEDIQDELLELIREAKGVTQ